MFSRAFPKLPHRDELAFLDAHDYTACTFADQLRYCVDLCALPASVGLSFEIPVRVTTPSVHMALTYHALLLGTRFLAERLSSLRDPAQIKELRHVAGVLDWERTHGESQREAMRKQVPGIVSKFGLLWSQLQVLLEWAAQIEVAAGAVMPPQQLDPEVAPDLVWPLEELLLQARIARQEGAFSTARKLYTKAKRLHQWVAPKELEAQFLAPDVAALFIDHDPSSLPPPLAAASSSSSSSSVHRGIAPSSVLLQR